MGKRSIYGISIALALCVGAFSAMGCTSNAEHASPSAVEDAVGTGNLSSSFVEQFPLQSKTLNQTRVNAKGIVIGHSVENLRDICEAPTLRDQNGDPILDENGNVQMNEDCYDEKSKTYDINKLTDEQLSQMNLKSGCVSCKSSRFNEIYELQGAAAFDTPYNAEARAIIDDDYFDCALCHDIKPSSNDSQASSNTQRASEDLAEQPNAKNLQPSLMYFDALGTGLSDRIDERNGVCAQCHNSYDYRSVIKTEEDLQTIKAYRNGYDVDSLFETCWEDGVNFETDEATGIASSYLVHPTIELYMGTKMQLLGVTCVDCHMPKSTDENGEQFTDHFAANSPIESEDALTYCLNCHEQQGIESTESMAKFVRKREAQLAEGLAALMEREASFRQALEQAVSERGKDDPSLDESKKLYAKVTWYVKCLETGPSESPGSQAAMLDWEGILKKANAACDEGVSLFD